MVDKNDLLYAGVEEIKEIQSYLQKLGINVIHDIDEITNPENSICVIRTHGATPQDINKIK